jgi:predicted RNA-binding Zn-ribbon protein involved in translation (DUF1610 family)
MSDCGTCGPSGGGPFSEGVELVEFVAQAHDGTIATSPIPDGGLKTNCQGCGAEFVMTTFVFKCPKCDAVHAVSPPRCDDPANIQFAGAEYKLPQDR